ncbi:hypothetical protein N7456_006252 [Penicillium angulare]|uniref:Methyltransferase n=1 Tax=Penicillium angulare TaxID=116970 RepID=A0A9W9KBI0_9EURO|nr:hypothetical protein N7456_006252 [Penicillium angulare]
MAAIPPNMSSHINFIADLPKYKVEKPFFFHHSVTANLDVEEKKATDNLTLLPQPVKISSMRDNDNISLDRNGFCYIQHQSKYLPGSAISLELRTLYAKETEELLTSSFNAELAFCYDVKLRSNSPEGNGAYELGHPLFVENTVAFPHSDISLASASPEIKGLLDEDQLKTYSQPGYRFRLINTWRSLLPKCEDRPLVLCDYSSLDMDDLVATDRVRPNRSKELYILKYSQSQQWYWLPDQRSDELFMFLVYDSLSDGNARLCPHTSVDNPLAPIDAPPRESVETRTLVITKM